jgi:hypothetical protein
MSNDDLGEPQLQYYKKPMKKSRNKQSKCESCGKDLPFHGNGCPRKYCDDCRIKRMQETNRQNATKSYYKHRKVHFCILCNAEIKTIGSRKYCSQCRRTVEIQRARASLSLLNTKKQQKQSEEQHS